MAILTLESVVTSTLEVPDDAIEGMSFEDIKALLIQNPEHFGRDDNPVGEDDILVSVVREDE